MPPVADLINGLRAFDSEREWFEFKVNWFNPKELGSYISALSNSAAYEPKLRSNFSTLCSGVFIFRIF